MFVFSAADEAATDRLGELLAKHLPPGMTVALSGTLGAGKTRLVQAIAAGLGIDRQDVLSPTFVLGQHYHGRRTLHHFDLYRLKDEDEFLELGPEEYFESDGITLVEWAERFPRVLPEDRLEIEIRVTGETTREFKIRATGEKSTTTLRVVNASSQAAMRDPGLRDTTPSA
jgi:tRNA threonylcarbamoyladenosine biosynthesis protein TsaE